MDERLHHNVPSLGLTVASYGMSNIRLTSLHLVSRRTNGSANAVRLSREQLLIEKLARSVGVYGVQKEALVLLPQLYLSLWNLYLFICADNRWRRTFWKRNRCTPREGTFKSILYPEDHVTSGGITGLSPKRRTGKTVLYLLMSLFISSDCHISEDFIGAQCNLEHSLFFFIRAQTDCRCTHYTWLYDFKTPLYCSCWPPMPL